MCALLVSSLCVCVFSALFFLHYFSMTFSFFKKNRPLYTCLQGRGYGYTFSTVACKIFCVIQSNMPISGAASECPLDLSGCYFSSWIQSPYLSFHLPCTTHPFAIFIISPSYLLFLGSSLTFIFPPPFYLLFYA